MASTTAAALARPLWAALLSRWQRVRSLEERRFSLAIAAAVFIHMLPVLAATGILVPSIFVPPPKPPGAGDPAGVIDGVNVETIDAAEYDRRYLSFNAGRDAADTEPAETTPSKAQPPQQAMPTPQVKPPEPPPPEANAPGAAPLTEADVAEILAATKLDMESFVQSTSKASIANQGQASEFVRAVLRKLKQTMPTPKGLRGILVIRLIVSETGDVEQVAVTQSSGRPELDKLVLERVRATRLVAPGKTTPARERFFQITYEYY